MRVQTNCSGVVRPLFLTVGLLVAGDAWAQATDAPDTPVTTESLTADDIVIYGAKIERSFLDTPVSVGLITPEEITYFVINDTFEGFNLLANVRRLNTNGGNEAFMIRGLNADGISGIGNPANLVSMIIDGAPQNSEGLRRGARSTWDLERIEVLRGPQSGLYGRAALAGAVVLKSKDPTYDFEGAGQFNVGNLSAAGGAFMLSGPLVENEVALRISGEARKKEADITYADPLNNFFNDDQFANFRAKLLVEPDAAPGLRVLFTFNHAYDQTFTPLVSAPFFDRVYTGSGFASELRDAKINNYIADVSYEVADGYTLRSITSYVDTNVYISNAPGATGYFRNDLRDGHDFNQEVVLEIDDEGGTGLSGVVGIYYGSIVQDIDADLRIDIAAALGFPPLGILTPITTGTSTSSTNSLALYADLRYNIYGPFSLLGGLRYQRDTLGSKANTLSFDFGTGGQVPVVFDVDSTFNVILPSAGLAYDIDDEQSITVTARRGYRAGYTETVAGTAGQNDVDPEFVWTYELAYRFESADGRLRIGANAFYNDYTDQQIVIIDPNTFASSTLNAGESRSYGVEIEGNYDVGNGLNIFGALGLLKTEITDLPDSGLPNGACAPSGGNCAGNEFPQAPNVTASLGAIYRHYDGYFVAGDVNYTGSYYSNSDINNTPSRKIDGFFLVNASVGFEHQGFRAQVYVRNLLDNDYVTSISSTGNSGSIGEGRTIGAEFSVAF